jgi:hypothetical protein
MLPLSFSDDDKMVMMLPFNPTPRAATPDPTFICFHLLSSNPICLRNCAILAHVRHFVPPTVPFWRTFICFQLLSFAANVA